MRVSMRPRRLLLWIGGSLLIVAIFVCWTLVCPVGPFRFRGSDYWDKIYSGMTEDKVAAILECTAGDYRTGDFRQQRWYRLENEIELYQTKFDRGFVVRSWVGDHGALVMVLTKLLVSV
jgi:hypothetical protein